MIFIISAVAVSLFAMERAAEPAPLERSVWISDKNPSFRPGIMAQKPAMMSHGGGRGGARLWPVYEDAEGRLECIGKAHGKLLVYNGDWEPAGAAVSVKKGCTVFRVETEKPGRYTLYYRDHAVADDTLYAHTAKYELTNGGHGVKIEQKMDAVVPEEAVTFDIVRLKAKDEALFHRFNSGDIVTFRVVLEGKPLPGATLRLSTEGGWSKSVTTDQAGQASFQLIREYFPAWGEFDKRHKERFVVEAAYTVARAGAYEGKAYTKARYTATYPAALYPENSAYKSYAYALLFATAALLLSGIFIYLYRRRRQKPFMEVRFDEKD